MFYWHGKFPDLSKTKEAACFLKCETVLMPLPFSPFHIKEKHKRNKLKLSYFSLLWDQLQCSFVEFILYHIKNLFSQNKTKTIANWNMHKQCQTQQGDHYRTITLILFTPLCFHCQSNSKGKEQQIYRFSDAKWWFCLGRAFNCFATLDPSLGSVLLWIALDLLIHLLPLGLSWLVP